jgi:hypothetical protein
MSGTKYKMLDRKRYPKVEKSIKKSIKKLCEIGKYDNLDHNVDDIFDWWISNDSIEPYKIKKKLRIKL